MSADTAYFTFYKDSFNLIASKNITLMKESSNLPLAYTRILSEILASHKQGFAKDVEPSWLNVIFWIKNSMAFRMSVKMMDSEPMLSKEKFSLLGVL